MSEVKERKVSLLLGIGIFLIPLIFSWFTLRKGHTNLAKGVAFSWLVVTLIFACSVPSPKAEEAVSTPTNTTIAPVETVEAPENEEVAEAVEENSTSLTLQQKNAIRSAESYIRFKGFSRAGLIQQLSSEAGDGYPVEDATIAVDSLDVDWNEQAARSAKSYLDFKGFSCKGLIQQLSSEAGDEFTQSEAEYGAKKVGICE